MQHSLDIPIASVDLPFAEYAHPIAKSGWNGLLLVGEAPGAEEARLGKPFVGRSGQLLDKLLHKAGIDREACLIANVFRYQPPANKVDHFFISKRLSLSEGSKFAEQYGKFGSNFIKAEYVRELEHLRLTLTAKKPKAVLALGRTPLWALTGLNGLLTHVGKTLPCTLDKSSSVIATYHPSFILRGNWKLQDEWLSHFVMAKRLTEQ